MTNRRRRSSEAKNSTTPPTIPTQAVSEFTRGGIYDLQQPTVVLSHGTELGTWYPRGQAPVSAYYNVSNTADSMTPNVALASTRSFTSTPPTTPVPTSVLAGLTQSLADLTNFLSATESTTDEEETNG